MTQTTRAASPQGTPRLSPFHRRRWTGDLTLRVGLAVVTLGVTVILAVMMADSFADASPVYEKFGILGFVTGTKWAPSFTVYGAWPFIYGTLLTSLIGLVIAVPISVLIALLLTELAPVRLRAPFGIAVDLLAAVPSVVYGLWGLIVLVPAMRPLEQGSRRRSAPSFRSSDPRPPARATSPPASSWRS